eukprot:scaffold944_cov333-Pavlova_lutheri.AAC.15
MQIGAFRRQGLSESEGLGTTLVHRVEFLFRLFLARGQGSRRGNLLSRRHAARNATRRCFHSCTSHVVSPSVSRRLPSPPRRTSSFRPSTWTSVLPSRPSPPPTRPSIANDAVTHLLVRLRCDPMRTETLCAATQSRIPDPLPKPYLGGRLTRVLALRRGRGGAGEGGSRPTPPIPLSIEPDRRDVWKGTSRCRSNTKGFGSRPRRGSAFELMKARDDLDQRTKRR